jgi:hypothetical protein
MAEIGDWVDTDATGRVSHRDPMTGAVFVEFPLESLRSTYPPNSVLKTMIDPVTAKGMGLLKKPTPVNAEQQRFWDRLGHEYPVFPLLQGELVSIVGDVAVVKYEDPEALIDGPGAPNVSAEYNAEALVEKKPPKFTAAALEASMARAAASPAPLARTATTPGFGLAVAPNAPEGRGRARANANANLLEGMAGATLGGRRTRRLLRRRGNRRKHKSRGRK